MNKILRTGGAGLLLALTLAAPAAATDVTVRVEGIAKTLVPEVRVTPSAAVTVDKTATGGTTCDGAKGGGALELATGGDWGGPAFDFGSGPSQSVETIKGETYDFNSGAFWNLMVNNSSSPVGICDYVPAQGDEVLLYPACAGAPAANCFSGDPLDVTAPATAAPGAAVTVKVDQYTSPFGATPTKAPAAGATVTASDAAGTSATTGADGTAAVTLTQRGPVTRTATKGARPRDEVTVCVTDGADGFCGTAKPGEPAPPPPPPCVTAGDDGLCGTKDTRAPLASIAGIREKQAFRRAKAPRELKGTVAADPSGLATVKLGLSRSFKGRCQVLSGKRDAFRKAKCGAHPVFVIGDRPDWSYLLPARLKRGRYVLDVVAVDKAGNRDALARGRNRIVFTVK